MKWKTLFSPGRTLVVLASMAGPALAQSDLPQIPAAAPARSPAARPTQPPTPRRALPVATTELDPSLQRAGFGRNADYATPQAVEQAPLPYPSKPLPMVPSAAPPAQMAPPATVYPQTYSQSYAPAAPTMVPVQYAPPTPMYYYVQQAPPAPAAPQPNFFVPASAPPAYAPPAPTQPAYAPPAPTQPAYAPPAPQPMAYAPPAPQPMAYAPQAPQPIGYVPMSAPMAFAPVAPQPNAATGAVLTNQSVSVPTSSTTTKVRVRGPGMINSGLARFGERLTLLGRTRIETIQQTDVQSQLTQPTGGLTTISTSQAFPVVPQAPQAPQSAPEAPSSSPQASPQGQPPRRHLFHHDQPPN